MHVVSRRARVLRLRRTDCSLASIANLPLIRRESASWFCVFSKLNGPAHRYPCLRFERHLAMPPARLGGQDGVAFSLLVGLFHSLQHAGLSRRTLSNAVTGEIKHHFKWTAIRLIKSLGALHDSPVLLAALRYRLFDCSSKLTVWTTVPEAFPQAQSRARACQLSC